MSTRPMFTSEQSAGELMSSSLEECNKQLHDKKYTGGLDDVLLYNNDES